MGWDAVEPILSVYIFHELVSMSTVYMQRECE